MERKTYHRGKKDLKERLYGKHKVLLFFLTFHNINFEVEKNLYLLKICVFSFKRHFLLVFNKASFFCLLDPDLGGLPQYGSESTSLSQIR